MKYLAVLFFLLHTYSSISQLDSVPFGVGLGGGIDLIHNKDVATSPLSYNGFGLPVGINGFSLNERWTHRVEVSLILPLLTNNYALRSKADTQLKDWGKVSVRYQCLRRLQTEAACYVGGSIKLDGFLREYSFLDGYGWEIQNSLNLNVARSIPLTDQSFLLPQVSLPLVGYLHRRPSWTIDEAFLDDFHRGKPTDLLQYGRWNVMFDRWAAIDLHVLYHHQLNDHFSLQGQLGLNYYRIAYPDVVTSINLPLQCYLNYHF